MKIPFNVNLTGKTAIVTGGSGTLCSAMAYGLAVSGAKTAIIGRNKANMEKVVNELTSNALKEHNAAVTIRGYCSDVTDKEELTKTYEAIKAELGSCDILINGAGGNQPGAITSIEMLKKSLKMMIIHSGILMKQRFVRLWSLTLWELFFLSRYSHVIWLKKEAEVS